MKQLDLVMKKNNFAKFFPYPLVSATFLISFTFFYFNCQTLFFYPDAPWHIATGDLIRKIGEVPYTDPWSYTANYTNWYNISWLWDVGLSFIVQYIGLEGLYFLTLALYAFTLSLLCYFLLKRNKFKDYAICTTLLIAMLVLWVFVNARPQITSYILAIFFHNILHNSRKHKTIIDSNLWILPFLMALWINLHGGFLIGFTVIGAYVIESYINKNWEWLKRLILIGFLCLFSIITSFYGWEISNAVLRTLSSPMTKFISEWKPFIFSGQQIGPTLSIMTFILISNSRDKGLPLADKIIAFAWLFAAFFSSRNLSVYTVLSAPYFAYCLGKIGHPKPFFDLSLPSLRMRFFAYAVIVTLLLVHPKINGFITNNKDIVLGEKKVPLDAINYILENHPKKTFLNTYEIGGYIIYYSNGKLKPFIDGRAGTAYPNEAISDYITFLKLEKDWERIVPKYDIQGIIAQNSHRFVKAFNGGFFNKTWQKEYGDETATVYIRKDLLDSS